MDKSAVFMSKSVSNYIEARYRSVKVRSSPSTADRLAWASLPRLCSLLIVLSYWCQAICDLNNQAIYGQI